MKARSLKTERGSNRGRNSFAVNRKYLLAAAFLFGVTGASASSPAGTVTFEYAGTCGGNTCSLVGLELQAPISGSFSFDSSVLTGASDQFVSGGSLTAFEFTYGNVVYDFSEVRPGGATVIDGSGATPSIVAFAGALAEKANGDFMSPFLNQVTMKVSGQVVVSAADGVWTLTQLEPDETTVSIDIKPGSDPNSINLCSGGTTPIAIFGSGDFDVITVDPGSLTLADADVRIVGKSDKILCNVEDVDFDGFDDLVCQFITVDLALEQDMDTTAELNGNLLPEFGGTPIVGSDSVNIVKDCN